MTSKRVVARPTSEQRERWEAAKGDLSWTELVSQAIEGWMKSFGPEDIRISPDDTAADLRDERNNLRDELQQAHNRIETLESQLYDSEAHEVARYVEANPEAEFDEIVDYVADGGGERVADHLDRIEMYEEAKRSGIFNDAEMERFRADAEAQAIEEKGFERVVAEDYPEGTTVDDAYPPDEMEDVR